MFCVHIKSAAASPISSSAHLMEHFRMNGDQSGSFTQFMYRRRTDVFLGYEGCCEGGNF